MPVSHARQPLERIRQVLVKEAPGRNRVPSGTLTSATKATPGRQGVGVGVGAGVRVKVGEAIMPVPGRAAAVWVAPAMEVGVPPPRPRPPIRTAAPPIRPASRKRATRPPTAQTQTGTRRTDIGRATADLTVTPGVAVTGAPEVITGIRLVRSSFGRAGAVGIRSGVGCQAGTGSPSPRAISAAFGQRNPRFNSIAFRMAFSVWELTRGFNTRAGGIAPGQPSAVWP